MASVHLLPGSKYWKASLTIAGRRTWRSTKTTDRRKAEVLCAQWQRELDLVEGRGTGDAMNLRNPGEFIEGFISATRDLAAGSLTEDKAKVFLSRMLEEAGLDPLKTRGTRDFLQEWLQSVRASRKARTAERYAGTVEAFLRQLGHKADKPLGAVTLRDVELFRAERLNAGASSGTVATDIKTLRAVFQKAVNLGLILKNPASGVELGHIDRLERDVFTPSEVDLLLDHAPQEWQLAVLLGFYGGMRLGDVAALRWDAVDFGAGMIRYQQEKVSGRGSKRGRAEFAIHPALMAALEAAAGDTASPYVMPGLAGRKAGGRRGLSAEFAEIMKRAGLDRGEKVQRSGRKFSARSFHSLRHTNATNRARVAETVTDAMAGTGHASADVFARYAGHLTPEDHHRLTGKLPALRERKFTHEGAQAKGTSNKTKK